VGRGTITTILKQHGIEPAPKRQKRTTWREFSLRSLDAEISHAEWLPDSEHLVVLAKHEPGKHVIFIASRRFRWARRVARWRAGRLHRASAGPIFSGVPDAADWRRSDAGDD